MYQILIEKQVQKKLENIPEPNYSHIKNSINDLAKNPRPLGFKKLKARTGYPIRQGNYRVVYDINDQILTVFILADRKDIYD